MAGPKPLRTEFGIRQRLESCEQFTFSKTRIKKADVTTWYYLERTKIFLVAYRLFPFLSLEPPKLSKTKTHSYVLYTSYAQG